MEMTDPPRHDFRTVSLNKLKVLSKDVDDRRNILGKSWDELQLALSQYHASLVVRQEQFELQTVDSNAYVTKLENELQKRITENDQIKTKLSDLECKLRAIQEENLSLRTEKERLENDVRLKENLMIKIQNQMSKESLEYSAEISALKDSLSKMSGGQRKRPRSTQSPVSKSDAAPSDSTHKDAPPTFSVATMPHLALATTSSEALESDTTYDYDVSNSVATVNHQVIQVPPLSQAKGKKTRTSPRPKPPRVEFVQPGQVTAHACKVCGRSFGARYDLQRHERIHSGEKPFFCSGCNRRFARKDHLRLHMVRVHGLEDGASLQKESVEILIQGEDRDPLTVLREQQLAYQESLQGMIKEENGAMFPSNLYDT